MYGKKENQTKRIFGISYFLCTIALLLSTVCFLSSEQSGAVLHFVLHTFVRQDAEKKTTTPQTDEMCSDAVYEVPASESIPIHFFDTAQNADVIYQTPADVEDMEAEYLAVFATKNTDGEILEDDFSSSGATDRILNAVIRNATASKKPDFENTCIRV